MKNEFLGNRNLRNLHRDLGYFYVGLIIAFAISGIAQNHRKQWKPDKYLFENRKIETAFRLPKDSITKEAVEAFSKEYQLQDFKQFDFKKDSSMVIAYKDAEATIHLTNGKGEINIWRKKPVLAQFYFLHKYNGNDWWIWYSDIFAASLLFIAISGMFLMKGKNSFRKRGWIFALAGIIFPVMMLLLFFK